MIVCWHYPMTDKCYLKRGDETEEITGITREFVEEILLENERLREKIRGIEGRPEHMSTRWMLVQYVGDTLRLPVACENEMDKPFGSSNIERDIRRIVTNPFSESLSVFVPEEENAKLRKFARDMWCMTTFCHGTSDAEIADMYRRMRELGIMENYGEEMDA